MEVGDEVDGWNILEELGEGHYSPVWRVGKEGTDGALKPGREGDATSQARVKIEVQALKQLNHPGIPKLLDASKTRAAVPYLVMELVSNATVLDRIKRWNKMGRVHGEIETIELVTQLAEIVKHIHDVGMVHRDIKDANITYAKHRVWLIDFGLAKKENTRDVRMRDSYFPTGAARFSPDSKLEDSVLARKTHDMYAVGVLAYRLLTGHFPYGEEDDPKALRERYRTMTPSTACEVNPLVSPGFSRIIDRLITQEDDERLTVEQLLEDLAATNVAVGHFANEFVGAVHGRIVRARRPRFPRVLRDPIGGDIRFNEFEYEVLNTAQMQRLRWIRQLGLTNLVYPGAEHSRLSHSIGTVHTLETMMRAIEDESGIRIDPDTRSVARLYALTHDVTHIAFGHTIEDQLGFFPRHDENAARFNRMLNSESSELRSVLDRTDHGRAVVQMLDPSDKKSKKGLAYEAVAGTMGADVLDYIDRDAYHCGLDHRVDTAIYRQLAISGPRHSPAQKIVSLAGGKYGPRADRTLAIDHLLSERYAMFLKVYTNNNKIAADALLGKALGLIGKLDETKFEDLGDETLLDMLIHSRANKAVSQIGKMLRLRKLPQGAYRANLLENVNAASGGATEDAIIRLLDDMKLRTPAGRKAMEEIIAEKAKVESERVYLYVPVSAPGYQRAKHWVLSGTGDAVRHTSDTLSQQHLGLWELWIFVDSRDIDERRRVAQIAQAEIGLTNLIPHVSE